MTMMLATAALGGAPVVSVSSISSPLAAFVFGGAATAVLTIENDGDIIENTISGDVDVGDWIAPKTSAGSGYDVKVTVNSGSVSSGTTGSWLGLGTTRSWSQTKGTAGIQTANVTVEIRNATTLTVLDSKTFDFSAEYGS